MRIAGQPALVMQRKPYRETSALVQLFTRDYGRVAAVARGVSGKRGARAELQPFNELTVSLSGRGSLMSLHATELTYAAQLKSDALAGGFYMLELISRLLREHDAHPRLFALTCELLRRLQPGAELAPLLRIFEKYLLDDLGFGLDFAFDVDGAPINLQSVYTLRVDHGFAVAARGESGYLGVDLERIARDDYAERSTRVAAKRLFRRALAPHLGPRPLASRALLAMRRSEGGTP